MERPVKRIVIDGPEAPGPRAPASRASAPLGKRGAPLSKVGWIVPPLMMAAVASAVLLVVRGPDLLFGLALAALFGIGFAWIVISVLWPGRAERRCPSCGAQALERIDAGTTSGIRCTGCGYRDEHQSAWLLAEEEGPLERTILRERALRRAGRVPPASRAGSPPTEEHSR